jgi:hypothetical protein
MLFHSPLSETPVWRKRSGMFSACITGTTSAATQANQIDLSFIFNCILTNLRAARLLKKITATLLC